MSCLGKFMTGDQHKEIAQRKASKKIDKQLQADFKVRLATPLIFLTGYGGSGKSTVQKQINLLYGNGFTIAYRKHAAQCIRNNLKDAIKEIVDAMNRLTSPCQLACPENQFRVEYIKNNVPWSGFDFPSEFYEHTKILWNDEGVQTCFARSNEYGLTDCAHYFLNKIDTVKPLDYIPSDQDLLRCYMKHYDQLPVETTFQVDESQGKIFDVCMYTRRRFWANLFFHSTVFIYVADVSCNTALHGEMIRLQESLEDFKRKLLSKLYSRHWQHCIIFLNKQDLLAAQVLPGKYELEKFFPEFAYYTTPNDVTTERGEDPLVTRAKYFIRDEFLNVFYTILGSIQCYLHFTCAINTENFQSVFRNCWDDIMASHRANNLL